MASFTTPTVYPTGVPLAVTDFDSVGQNTLFLYERPYCSFSNTATTSCPSGAPTPITLGVTNASGYGFSVVSNNVVVPLTGIYQVSFSIQTSAAGSGNNSIISQIQHNGATVITGSCVPSYGFAPISSGAGIVSCSASDTLTLVMLNQSGSTLTAAVSANATFIAVAFIGSV